MSLALTPRPVARLGISGFATCDYQPKVATLIHEFKEENQTSLAKVMAIQMAVALKNFDLTNTALVPMPSKSESFAKRGYEPGAVLAKSLARSVAAQQQLLLPVQKDLRFDRVVADQASLSGRDRRTNLIGTMVPRKTQGRIEQRNRAILIDDVVTTGATLTEGKRCLEQIRVEVLGFVTFAETLPKNRQKANGNSL